MIINGELQTGLGGGVCQVSTTVFNAAYEAGLDITARTNHALYISHYPQGRDATVNYPDLDLKFVNDTEKWLLLRTFVGASSLTVNLYGTPQHRRVESEVGALRVVGAADELARGTRRSRRAAAWSRTPARLRARRALAGRSTTRRALLLHDDTWYSSYRGEKKIVLVGTKPKPEPQARSREKSKDEEEAPPADETVPPADGADVAGSALGPSHRLGQPGREARRPQASSRRRPRGESSPSATSSSPLVSAYS